MIKRLAMGALLTVTAMTGNPAAAQLPSETGQGAFAALAEIARLLSEDEGTDWSRVNLLALREHLVDMDEVTMRAAVDEEPVEGGVLIRVSGEGRTLEALQRMIPMHSGMMRGHSGWQIDVRPRPDGFDIELTAADAGEVARLRGLGFFGFLAAGDHHRRHHLGIAAGTMMHGHHASHGGR